ncbi:uncharacterized protein B0T23DRAFT_382318, partial [Neurospora hispaniola]
MRRGALVVFHTVIVFITLMSSQRLSRSYVYFSCTSSYSTLRELGSSSSRFHLLALQSHCTSLQVQALSKSEL